jgi:hypothetical protein
MVDKEQRRRWRKHSQLHATIAAAWSVWAAGRRKHQPPRLPEIPQDLVGMTCGTRTRAGTPCKLSGLYANGRYKLHGGKSTGPKSEAGRRQSAENGKKGGRPRAQNLTP